KQLAPLPKGSSNEDEVQNASDELHVWLSDWTGQARAFITRGDYLIRLGLSTRKGRVDDELEDELDEELDDDVDVEEAEADGVVADADEEAATSEKVAP